MTDDLAVRTRTLPRSVGFWMAVLGALYLLSSATRAAITPVSFAHALGLPLTNPADDGFVYVYATRSAAIGLLALALAWRRDIAQLALLVIVSAGVALLDVVLIASTHGSVGAVAQQAAGSVYLMVTWYLLRRYGRGQMCASST
jgi:hypothetical protein